MITLYFFILRCISGKLQCVLKTAANGDESAHMEQMGTDIVCQISGGVYA